MLFNSTAEGRSASVTFGLGMESRDHDSATDTYIWFVTVDVPGVC